MIAAIDLSDQSLSCPISSLVIYFPYLGHLLTDPAGGVHKAAIYAGTFIGGITFTGSLTAFGKLQGLLDSRPLNLPGKNPMNIAMALGSVGGLGVFMTTPETAVGLGSLGMFDYNTDEVLIVFSSAFLANFLTELL